MEALIQDIRYGIRQLFRQRGSSIVAVATLALGIGVSTAVLSVIDATMLRPLPYPDPEQLTTNITFKLPPWFTVSLITNQTFARLPEGDFVARIFSSNISYAASPTLSFSNLVQYDNRSRNLGWQSRMRWTLQPGSDLFFAFRQGWIQEVQDRGNLRFRTEDSKLSGKFQYSFRF